MTLLAPGPTPDAVAVIDATANGAPLAAGASTPDAFPAHDPRVPPPVPDEELKLQGLRAMQRRATGLLVAAAVLFVAARAFEVAHPWVGYLRAFAEAAMVGGLADWFAVTALFRHPLGIPIPHTAIVPSRKDRIGRSLGRFVQQNFLSREVVGAKLAAARPGERAARWLADPAHARLVARQVATGLSGAADVLRDDDVNTFVERSLVTRLRKVQAGPLVGRALGLLTADGRHQELLDEALRIAARGVADNQDVIRARIAAEAPWWVPGAVEDKLHQKIVDGLERTLQQVSADPHHPLRARFDDAVRRFAERLRTSPETIARAEAVKEELLTHPAVREYAGGLWGDVKRALARQAESLGHADEGAAPNAVERGLTSLAGTVLADPALAAKLDGWIVDAVLAVIEEYRDEVSQLIESTVAGWDPAATSHRIEVQIGRDLQFIRINGTLVGGLVGLGLYALGQVLDRIR
ncbi:hypothetical protein tb265_03340 [Gemmatimonadetes bacterium T265]|nr:hypothetical protein tb265_03340 [Gemmatimonadetes bacterium T265]